MKQFDDVEPQIKKVLADNDQAALKKMWQHLDFNGNNVVSLAEIDKFIVESYPVLNHKPALMRAYKYTIQADPQSRKDEFVHKKEFKKLLANLFYFNKLFWVFDQVDNDKDRRLNFQEFKQVLTVAGSPMSDG